MVIINFVFIACSKDNKRNKDFLPLVSIEIPEEVKDDPKLVEVIKSSEKAINEFSDNIEQLVLEGKEVLDKKEEERSLGDNLKIGKLTIQFVSNSAELAGLIDEFDNYKNNQKDQGLINDAQLKALEKVGESFENRMKEINNKYKF